MTDVKLKPCPFCGEEVELVYSGPGSVYCLGCHMLVEFAQGKNYSDITEIWNTRIYEKIIDDLVYALEEALSGIGYTEHYYLTESAAAEAWSFVNGYEDSPDAREILGWVREIRDGKE